jgi:hypothetical protein
MVMSVTVIVRVAMVTGMMTMIVVVCAAVRITRMMVVVMT